jgi:hypothetical protein
MSSIIIFPDLYRFSQQGREYCSLIAQPLMLSELKIMDDQVRLPLVKISADLKSRIKTAIKSL